MGYWTGLGGVINSSCYKDKSRNLSFIWTRAMTEDLFFTEGINYIMQVEVQRAASTLITPADGSTCT